MEPSLRKKIAMLHQPSKVIYPFLSQTPINGVSYSEKGKTEDETCKKNTSKSMPATPAPILRDLQGVGALFHSEIGWNHYGLSLRILGNAGKKHGRRHHAEPCSGHSCHFR